MTFCFALLFRTVFLPFVTDMKFHVKIQKKKSKLLDIIIHKLKKDLFLRIQGKNSPIDINLHKM